MISRIEDDLGCLSDKASDQLEAVSLTTVLGPVKQAVNYACCSH